MKALTIEELKVLKVGDWVWVVRGLDTETPCSHYGEIEGYGTVSLTHSHVYLFVRNRGVHNLKYSNYGKTWLAYKNKEQAEAKSEIVELPCNIGDPIWVVYRDFDHGFNEYKIYESICTGFAFEHGTKIRIVTAFCCYDFDRVGNYTDKSEAEQRLRELQKDK